MSILIFFLISYVLLSISLYLLFPKAGVPAVTGLIPGKNFIEWAKLIGRPAWWPLLLLVPIVNIFIFAGMAVNLVRSFKKYSFASSAAAVIYAPAAFAWIAKNDATYDGPNYIKEKEYLDKVKEYRANKDSTRLERLESRSPYKKSFFREWIESIVFAVFAAAFIRMFLVEAFVIPTPSMEGSLMVGDFLFVSKASYGMRTPMTVAMIPLLHNRIPGVNKESYLKKPSLDYHRLPALEDIKRNKPIVFNWPVGDSVYITRRRSYTVGQLRRNPDFMSYDPELRGKVAKKDFVIRPLDKKDHYIKRCVAVPGDTIQVIDRQIYINGKKGKNPSEMQFLNTIAAPPNGVNRQKLIDWGIGDTDSDRYSAAGNAFYISEDQKAKLEEIGFTTQYYKPGVEPVKLFPHDPKITKGWTVDNYGPIWLPKAGTTVELTTDNIALYRRVIGVYEGNKYEERNGQFFINGEASTSYTFKQDYFWAMGDNRHNSEDSRMWGFVPHDHIVGKPLFIWFSTRNSRMSDGIRLNRMFKSADVE